MRATIEGIRAECRRNAGGDWDRWEEQSSAFRADLAARVRAAKPYRSTAAGTSYEARFAVLEGKGDFPLFEAVPEHYLAYLFEPKSLEAFRKERPVAAGARWLKRRGIDVIFVPVPKMTEVYAEYFADHCPADRIVAPHVRRLLLELLEADVEVVDLLPSFLEERDKYPEPLYQPADPHWAPRAQALAAKAIANRLGRYDFVTRALAGPAISKAALAPYYPVQSGATFPGLTPGQRRRAERGQPRTFLSITGLDGRPFQPTPSSPVVVIGDSYNCGLQDFLVRELNLPLHSLGAGGQTTQKFKDFLRDPDLLKDCKVVVWLVCNSHLAMSWPLPEPIRQAVEPRGQK
jgi:hypothetical protein